MPGADAPRAARHRPHGVAEQDAALAGGRCASTRRPGDRRRVDADRRLDAATVDSPVHAPAGWTPPPWTAGPDAPAGWTLYAADTQPFWRRSLEPILVVIGCAVLIGIGIFFAATDDDYSSPEPVSSYSAGLYAHRRRRPGGR